MTSQASSLPEFELGYFLKLYCSNWLKCLNERVYNMRLVKDFINTLLLVDGNSPQKWIHTARDIKEGSVMYQAKVCVFFVLYYCLFLTLSYIKFCPGKYYDVFLYIFFFLSVADIRYRKKSVRYIFRIFFMRVWLDFVRWV